ncbi:hypothetical protein [Nocardioides sp. AE5]|nr:hypothetical protein [Nocardioides sp. AE5]MDT0202515.1 hypothetical protein [Nocardioides sp. AE5]
MRKLSKRVAAIVLTAGISAGLLGATAVSAQAIDSSWGRGEIISTVLLD